MTQLSRKLAVVMDPIADINPNKDTTLGLLEAAQRNHWELIYFERTHLYLCDGRAAGYGRSLKVSLDSNHWHDLDDTRQNIQLDTLDLILMRIDPPVDLEFLHTCQILEYAQQAGTLVTNNPRSIRIANEKVFAQNFPELTPPTIVSANTAHILDFVEKHHDVVLKPLNQMGGRGIIRLKETDPKREQQIAAMTHNEQRTITAQRLIPEYVEGDKRILLIDGKVVPKALLRIPPPGQLCANIAAGGHGQGADLNERDLEICAQVAPVMRDMGLLFVGLDVIGSYLTEINVTSPTCMRELNHIYKLDIGMDVIHAIEARLQ